MVLYVCMYVMYVCMYICFKNFVFIVFLCYVGV